MVTKGVGGIHNYQGERESFCYLGAKYDGVYSGLKSKITVRIHLGASRVVFIQLTVTCMYASV